MELAPPLKRSCTDYRDLPPSFLRVTGGGDDPDARKDVTRRKAAGSVEQM